MSDRNPIRGLYRAPYATSKGGILALSKVLSMEYGGYGIRINTMSPGGTDIKDRTTPREFVGTMVVASRIRRRRLSTKPRWRLTFAISRL